MLLFSDSISIHKFFISNGLYFEPGLHFCVFAYAVAAFCEYDNIYRLHSPSAVHLTSFNDLATYMDTNKVFKIGYQLQYCIPIKYFTCSNYYYPEFKNMNLQL